MERAAQLGKKLGVDYLKFRPMQIHRGGRFYYHWTDVENRIEGCLKYSGNGFQVLFSQHKYEMAKDKQYGRYYHKCYGQQFATVIAASAKMYICCHTRGYHKYCIGDLRKSSFKEIWNSKKRQRVISSIDFKDCIPLCRDNTFNQILWNIKQPREHVNFL
jgi:sulfatase maturation enzyme AslB (radical SAM superfamily)